MTVSPPRIHAESPTSTSQRGQSREGDRGPKKTQAPAPLVPARPVHLTLILFAAAVCAALGLIVTIGWTTSEFSLTRALSGGRAMQPLTAAGLMLTGATLASLAVGWRTVATVGAVVVLVLGLQAGVQTLTGSDFGTDALLFPEQISRQVPAVAEPGRTALLSAILFVLFATSCIAVDQPRWRRLAVVCTSTGMAIALLSLIGFVLLSGDPLPGVDAALVMPIHTAFGLAIAFAGLLLARPEGTWLQLLLGDDWTGRTGRLLLTTATVPIPIAWLAEQGHRAGLYGTDVRMLLVVLGGVLLLAVLALKAADLLGHERRERDEFARAVDQSPNLLIDTSGKIIDWSKGCQDLYGWSADEAIGRNCRDMLGDCGPVGETPADTWTAQAGGWQREVNHRSEDGRNLSVMVRCIVYDRGMQRLPTALLSITDLTEERRAQNELLARDADLLDLQRQLVEVSRLSSMGELAAALAHELNQPLTAAANFLGAVELALKDEQSLVREATRDRIRDAVIRAKHEALRGGEIVRRLRDFIARGEADTRTESLSKLVSEAVLLGLPPALRKSIDVKLDISRDADCVLADRVQIQQVIVNLVRNAAEAMAGQTSPPAALVITSKRAAGQNVEVCVGDTGPGIPEEVSARLFSPFTSSKATGMGVGLSICKRIIEAHGGKIWTTPAQGRGTEFHFTLPAMRPSEHEHDK